MGPHPFKLINCQAAQIIELGNDLWRLDLHQNANLDLLKARLGRDLLMMQLKEICGIHVTTWAPVSVVHEPLASPAKELGDCQYINGIICVDSVENSRVDADRARKTDALDEGTNNDLLSSFKGNRVLGLLQGHEVNLEFVCLLDRIMHKYPKTFEHFTLKNNNLCTMNLNMLCTSLNDFTKISMTDVNSDVILEFRDVFAYLKSQVFNVSWLVNGLIPELYEIDCHIDDASSKLQDLQALRMEKMTEFQNDFGIWR
ncbi:uncharacterized protein LOC141669532 isoform X2 [Apium graveolens]|uniref:uncharacterized protein LOC141669532 isoform X2 n=1 Tax=Apium graveolens TaxID=4045 RepID=UPI003D794C0B